jgi:hypothetical protein
VTPSGPPLGNVEAPDSYLRIKQNIDALQSSVTNLNKAFATPQALTPNQLSQVRRELQAGGTQPLNLTNLPGVPQGAVASVNMLGGAIVIIHGAGVNVSVSGQNIVISLPNVGPGAGTYTTGLKLTGGGNNGSITIDAQGRITAITPAS